MGEIQKADPQMRRWVLVGLGVGSAIAALLLARTNTLMAALTTWITADPAKTPDRIRLVLGGLSLGLGGSLLGMAAYGWRLGHRVVVEQRFPPAGMATLRDVNILQGQAAVVWGRRLQGFAGLLGGLGLAVAVIVWRLTALLSQGSW